MSKKHYATKLKERIAELEAEVRALVIYPDSIEAREIKERTFFEKDTEEAIWAGDTSIECRDGILSQMSDPNIKYIETTNINIDKLMGDALALMMKDYIKEMIDYCRSLEKDYVEGDGTKSGVSVLHELVQQGLMSVYHYAHVVDAVVNYKTPYKINIVDKDE